MGELNITPYNHQTNWRIDLSSTPFDSHTAQCLHPLTHPSFHLVMSDAFSFEGLLPRVTETEITRSKVQAYWWMGKTFHNSLWGSCCWQDFGMHRTFSFFSFWTSGQQWMHTTATQHYSTWRSKHGALTSSLLESNMLRITGTNISIAVTIMWRNGGFICNYLFCWTFLTQA